MNERPTAGMAPTDIARLVSVGDPRVAPDGRRVAFVVTTVDVERNRYEPRVWTVAADGTSPPTQLTSGDVRASTPRWSPDGASVAYTAAPGDEGVELRVVAADGSGDRLVCTWPEAIDELDWAPDGASLCFVARVADDDRSGIEKEKDQPPRRIDRLAYRQDDIGWTVGRRSHVHVVAADGASPPRSLTTGDFEDAGARWSPDGALVAFASGRHDTWDVDFRSDVHVVDLTGGEPVALTGDGASYSRPSWAPDGARVAFVWTRTDVEPTNARIGVLDVASNDVRLLGDGLDRTCEPFPWDREPLWDGDRVLFGVEDRGVVHLYAARADGGSDPEPVVGGSRSVTSFDVGGGTLAFVATEATALPELHVVDGAGERRLTSFGDGFTAQVALSTPTRFVVSAPDGTELDAWLHPPVAAGPGPWPTLLNVHGGPFTQYGERFFDEFQLQAGAGFAVLACNPRGSSGREEAFGRAIRSPLAAEAPGTGWGGVDADDLLTVVDAAVARFPEVVDGERLGLLGGSYGGYMTTLLVGRTGRFRAACSERAVNDLTTMLYQSDFAPAFPTVFGTGDLDELRRMSPINGADRITTPLLILHSESDLRCPISQAEALFVALKLRGHPVEFWRFPGESHELTRSGSPKHRVQRAEILLDFFRRHLLAARE